MEYRWNEQEVLVLTNDRSEVFASITTGAELFPLIVVNL
jgi:hypothetical protein